jgi:hypothetical protein
VAQLAWRAQPPDDASDEPADEAQDEEAEVVDLTKQRLLGWLKGMFGGDKPPSDER